MFRVLKFMKEFHPLVHVILIGTVFISLSNSMSVVYLPIYLMNASQIDPATVGFIVGISALTSTIGGFIGGSMSDSIGRNRVIIFSLLVLGGVFIGFIFIHNVYLLALINIVRGLFSSFFLTISKALVADLTPEGKRVRVFSTRYVLGNIGYSIGPIIGTFFGIAGNPIAFLFTSVIYVVYFFLFITFIYYFRIKDFCNQINEKIDIYQAFNVFKKDRPLLLFVIGSIFFTTVHGEMSVTLSQYLKLSQEEGIKIFGYLMSINGATVIFTQLFITKWSEKYNVLTRIILGGSLFALGELGFAFSTSRDSFIVSMIVFTFGEILIIPSEYAQIDEITPTNLKGMYYGAQGFSEFGNFIGPWFGGLLLSTYGGKIMFITMAIFCFIGMGFYVRGREVNKKINRITEVSNANFVKKCT